MSAPLASPNRPQFTLLTPPGRGAIATIAIHGNGAAAVISRLFRPASGKPLTDFPLGRVVFGRFRLPLPLGEGRGEGASEDLVVGLIGPDELEIHCHGGRAAAQAICDALLAAGAMQLTAAEWAYDQESDAIAAAALLDLADARTERTAAILLDQYRGALRRQLAAIDDALGSNDIPTAKNSIDQLLSRADLGLHLTSPWKIVIAGRPNAGKSSLMNALLGYERAIVFHQPGTTRDVLTATTAIDGWPIELRDTAGLHAVGQTSLSAAANASPDSIESEGITRAHAQIASADLVLLVADATAAWDDLLFQEIVDASRRRLLLIHNKSDLTPPSQDRPHGIPTSALTGHGLDDLCRAITAALIPNPPGSDTPIPFTPAQVIALQSAAECLRSGQLAAARQQLATMHKS